MPWHVHTDCTTTNQCFVYLRVIRHTCCVVNAAIWVTPSCCAKSYYYMLENQLFIQNQNVRVHCIKYITRCRGRLRHWATILKAAGSNSGSGNWYLLLTQSFRPHYGSGVESASNRNEYQSYVLGGKGGQCVGLVTFMCWQSRNSGILNVLHPSGYLQLRIGIVCLCCTGK
jgi:hypothetical protein